MKNFPSTFCLALLAALVLPFTLVRAQSGILLRTYNLPASMLLLDPARPRLYALLTQNNSVAVIDTDTNALVTTLFIGSAPADLAISPDGTRLYVANSGSTTAGVGVVDLTNLTVLPSLHTPFLVTSIAAGLDDRLYLASPSSASSGYPGIVQVDATTGEVQGGFGKTFSQGIALAISPDRRTLFFSADSLSSFDVSTAHATLLQQSTDNTSDPFLADNAHTTSLLTSHDGRFLLAPNGYNAQGTRLIPASDLDGMVGTFNTGVYPGVETFSTDDSMAYQVDSSTSTLRVFSTKTFTRLDSFRIPVPYDPSGGYASVVSIAASEPHGYLYAATGYSPTLNLPGKLLLVSTRTAPFFNGSAALTNGFFYLQFPNGSLFGYYNFNSSPYLYHNELGFEYPIDAADGKGGIYLYDFTSRTFLYTSSGLFPYLYDFTLNAFLYYYPDTTKPGHYTTSPRYFYNFGTGQIITK